MGDDARGSVPGISNPRLGSHGPGDPQSCPSGPFFVGVKLNVKPQYVPCFSTVA